jgi:hypothetical protein
MASDNRNVGIILSLVIGPAVAFVISLLVGLFILVIGIIVSYSIASARRKQSVQKSRDTEYPNRPSESVQKETRFKEKSSRFLASIVVLS